MSDDPQLRGRKPIVLAAEKWRPPPLQGKESANSLSARLRRFFDPIDLEILWSRLILVVDEAAYAIVRTSMSKVVTEGRDFGSLLLDPKGRLLAADVSVASKTGALGGKAPSEVFALVTNLTDPELAPALELAQLYSRRWKIEVLYKAIKVDLNGVKPVLRSGHADTVLAEVWSLLAVYQILLRLADAALTEHSSTSGDNDPGLERISIKAARGAIRRSIGQAVAHTAEAMAAFAEEVLGTLTHQRPARTTARKRKARRGEKLKTLRVTYKTIMHPMAARSIVAHAA